MYPHTTVVVLLSHDADTTEAFCDGLASVDQAIEVQVVPSVENLLTRLDKVMPDAMVIDVMGIAGSELDELLLSGPGAEIPTIVLAGGDFDRSAAFDSGATGFVDRAEPHFVRRLREEVLRTRRVASLVGRRGETEQHYVNILEASPDGIFVLVGGIFRYLNSSFEQAIGQRAGALLDITPLVSLVVPAQQSRVGEMLRRVEAVQDCDERIEMTLVTTEGERIFEVSLRASVVDGQRAVVGIARNVTAVRHLQREVMQARQRAAQVERLRALGELAAGVAHNFNNALGTILGRVRIAREKADRGQPVSVELAVIEQAASDAVETVKRIQDFSRPTGGETWEDVDLAAVAEGAVTYVGTTIPDNVTLESIIDPTPIIRGNSAELREVVLNLLTNALDSLTEGGKVRIITGEDDGRAVLCVEDDGCGMPLGVQRRIFEPFFSTKEECGTGLGLSVSHGILRRHDAQIDLTSTPGRGTRFRLTFAPFEPTRYEPPPIQKSRLTVLVVDDDAAVAELMSDLLAEQGHEVLVVANAEAAGEVLNRREIDLVITDLDLPDSSGWELSRQVRDRFPKAIVGLVTGWPLGVSQEELRQRGIDFALAKPFTIESLTAAVQKTQRNT